MDNYKTLKEEAYAANMEIPARGLAIYTWGNASAFDWSMGAFAIKPSGVPYGELKPQDMVVVDLDGTVVEGRLRPSSDAPTHRALYRAFDRLGGVTHTHSSYATAWAQAGKSIPIFGTTHADHTSQAIPCVPFVTEEAVVRDYETETGILIVNTFRSMEINPLETPMTLVAGHGVFTWGESAAKSVYHATVIEEVAKIAFLTLAINPQARSLPDYIVTKHYERKHGRNAYYGQ
ncbi:MAG: L-ribulose-5-phosphate 4-epimerase AraD [Treponema sp.]|jgi:L-ribulose-5-phosphate 4-epimerase|nr:L-ribulose-5-phosphate 4-epimerase AraD [Treponema sp.]